jgi:hypothetical protein
MLPPGEDSTDSVEAYLSFPNWLWGSEEYPLSLFCSQLDTDYFTQMQLSNIAQLLGAKELHSFITYLLRSYDYDYYTQVDRFFLLSYSRSSISSEVDAKIKMNLKNKE